MLPFVVLLLLLSACTQPVPGDDDDRAEPPPCLGEPGPKSMQIVSDDAEHRPLGDGVELVVQRQHQGAIATEIALRWTGVDGDEPLGALRASITDGDGAAIAEREVDAVLAPCDPHGGVGIHGFEVFYAFGGPMPDVDGEPATLSVRAGDLSASVTGTLRVP